MADQTLFHSLALKGFRAYLQLKTFDLGKKPSLAIFAPNGFPVRAKLGSAESSPASRRRYDFTHYQAGEVQT